MICYFFSGIFFIFFGFSLGIIFCFFRKTERDEGKRSFLICFLFSLIYSRCPFIIFLIESGVKFKLVRFN